MQDNELLNQIAELTAKINDLPNCPHADLTWSPRALGSGVSRPTVWPTPGGASPRSICLCGIDASVVELTADVALHHVLRRQVLNRYEVIVPDKLGGQFMQHVLPLAGNVLLQPRHLDPCLLPTLTPLCLSGELTLEAGKFLLVLSKVFVVRIFQTIVL